MTKNEMINDIIFDLVDDLPRELLDRVKITLLVKMQDYEVKEMTMLPAVIEHDNEWLLKRFLIDGIAKGTKESTLKQYIDAVKRLLASTGKNYRQITGQDITDYLAIRQYRDNISASYKSTLCRYFFIFFLWAYRKKHIPEDIMRDVDRIKDVQKRVERLTDEEIEDIREVCETLQERALFELMMSTGARVGEIAALNISDVDLLNKRVTIYGEKSSKYRTGLLTTKAVKALRAYIASRSDDNPTLFIGTSKVSRRLGKHGISSMAKDIAVRAGVTRIKATPHVYRKTFASVLYRKTKNILFVSKLLGHASTAITVQYYLVDDLDDMQHMYNIVTG